MSAPDRMLTRAEAAELLGMSVDGVARKVRRGEIPEYRYGPRQSRIAEADAIAYRDAHRRSGR